MAFRKPDGVMTSTLPRWLEHLLGVESADSGEGTVWRLQSAWDWAPWVTLLFAILTVAFVLFVYFHEAGNVGRRLRMALAAMRLSAIAILLFMIAEFVLSLERTGLPYVIVAVDDSASMGIVDRYRDEELASKLKQWLAHAEIEGPVSRINVAKAILLDNNAALLRKMKSRYKLRFYFISNTARAVEEPLASIVKTLPDTEATGQATRLGQGLRSILSDLRGSPPAAIVLLTDGITTDGPSLSEAALEARRRGVPLFTVGIGDEHPLRDLAVEDLLVDEVVFVDDIVQFEFKLVATGFEGRDVVVQLKRQGESQPLAQTTVHIETDGEPQTVQLAHRPEAVGEFEYVVEVEPLADEATAANNSARRVVSVRKEQIRVLLVQAYPSFEFRYLKNLLDRDKTIDLHTVLQEADPEYAQVDQTALVTFPVRRDDLFGYDTVIFGDVNPSFLSTSDLRHLAEFVMHKGGSMIFIAGPRYTPLAYRDTPLAPLMPVDLERLSAVASPSVGTRQGFRVQLTDLGLASPPLQLGDSPSESEQIWQNLPPLYWLFEASALRAGARVLGEHPTLLGSDGRRLPVIAMQYVGAGKTWFHSTDETWRWRFRIGDVFLARYWVQTIRYLSRSKLLGKDRSAELTTDRREYQRGEVVRLRVRFLDERAAPAGDDGVQLMVEHTGGKKRRVGLKRHPSARGVFEGRLTDVADGSYHVWLASPSVENDPPSADFLVVAPPGETERTRLDVAELSQAADLTKGRFYRAIEAKRLLHDLPRGRQVPIETLPPLVLWNRWPLLLLFLGLLVTEWVVRKQKGLL